MRAKWTISQALIFTFCGMKRLEVFLLPPRMMGSSQVNSPVSIHTPGWREHCERSFLPNDTTYCPRQGLEHGLLDSESSALTMRAPRVSKLKALQRVFRYLGAFSIQRFDNFKKTVQNSFFVLPFDYKLGKVFHKNVREPIS